MVHLRVSLRLLHTAPFTSRLNKNEDFFIIKLLLSKHLELRQLVCNKTFYT